ncbi:FMN-dependent NADH-azoreductase [Verrucomicrobium sp. GAS474]|uniref:FMN-dependent NADH-azoreductase n=1 Tax=Verrucomicrobium sp. GAS474 TaxID=1882831 RepID=UPI00087D6607|nr:NAD(P)H-dependent oxidoreductase [Verrucomicrobium sp. GAS474]SDT87793.1 FMN-dependent NADH-azoreductase [Verrucomicrobium sp. GAS474]
MPTLLHIEASPNGDASASGTVARHLAKKYIEHRPKWKLETVNLWAVRLPDLDPACLAAHGSLMNPGTAAAAAPLRKGEAPPPPATSPEWEEALGIAAHFASADALLFSVPMWNFGVPYRLKHYIDLVMQPGIAFAAEPDGRGHFPGKMTGKKAFTVYSRGGTWIPKVGEPLVEHQAAWLRQCLRFVGFSPIREIFVEPTSGSPKMLHHTLAAACHRAEEHAAE